MNAKGSYSEKEMVTVFASKLKRRVTKGLRKKRTPLRHRIQQSFSVMVCPVKRLGLSPLRCHGGSQDQHKNRNFTNSSKSKTPLLRKYLSNKTQISIKNQSETRTQAKIQIIHSEIPQPSIPTFQKKNFP